MATTITDDAIKAQWKKQNDAHQKAHEAVGMIAQHLGLSVDANGNIMAGDSPVAPHGSPTFDAEQLKSELAEIIKSALDRQREAMTGEEVFKRITEPWDKWLTDYITRFTKLVCVFHDKVDMAIKERNGQHPVVNQDKPTNAESKPLADGIHTVRQTVCKLFRWMPGFMKKVVADITSTWWKFAAYFIASVSISLAFYFWHQYRQLLPYVQEYAMVRAALGKDPENARTILDIHAAMEADDTDAVLRVIEDTNPSDK